MLEPACQHWADVSDREALGEPVSGADVLYRRTHEATCHACAREALVYLDLARGPGPEPAKLPAAAPKPRRTRARIAAAFAAVAALAAGLAAWVALRPPAIDTSPVMALTLLSVSGEAALSGAPASASATLRASDTLTLGDGAACLRFEPGVLLCAAPHSRLATEDVHLAHRRVRLLEGRLVASLEPQPAGSGFAVQTADGLVRAVGTVFSVEVPALERRSVARVLDGAVVIENAAAKRRLAAGEAAALSDLQPQPADAAAAELDRQLLRPGELSGSGASGALEVTARPLAIVSVDGVELGSSPVSVVLDVGAHAVEVRWAEGEPVSDTVTLGEGERVRRVYVEPGAPAAPVIEAPKHQPHARPRPAAKVAEPTAAELIAQARSSRTAGRYLEAARAYRRLLSLYPHSAEAHAALVSLGDLELGPLSSPRAALHHYALYLETGGENAEEARFGRVLALRALGEVAAADEAERAFAHDYPMSARAVKLRTRDGGDR